MLSVLSNVPETIDCSIEMKEVNEELNIHEGEYVVKGKKKSFNAYGRIFFKWFPKIGTYFKGTLKNNKALIFDLYMEGEISIIVKNKTIGNGFLLRAGTPEYSFTGIFSTEVFTGEKAIPVKKISFSVPNLKEIIGEQIKKTQAESVNTCMGRLKLEDEKNLITIDKCFEYKDLIKELKNKRGYCILYKGELNKKRGRLDYNEGIKTLYCLNLFLSFINGMNTSALFIKGFYENKEQWCDYTNYKVDNYEFTYNWSQNINQQEIKELWHNFYGSWKDIEKKKVLTNLVNWYVFINKNNKSAEAAIIMAQAAIELAYNWIIVEKKKYIVSNDSEIIKASNKIRLLLSQFKISNDIPIKFTNLRKLACKETSIEGAPEALVGVRNSIVHSQKTKREKFQKLNNATIAEVYEIYLWYVELSILFFLEYNGKYCNRTSSDKWPIEKEKVPWANL